jgi:hypothetical protein
MSIETYNGVSFYRLQIKMNTNPAYSSTTFKTPYHGKVFAILYAYTDPRNADEIENMLKTSRFEW